MTIYTFGDPELLREALLALATIFSLVEWSDPGSAMGLGGNMLAVALIGLLAVAVAGVTSQQVRVDYLLVALVLFGIMFSSNVDVNVEDIQTGDSNVVADIPVGIAMVASAASSAARSLTETTTTALQRPGVTTSIITNSGFMDPLRILYALRSLSFEELDEYAYKSMLEFYKICIGGTLRFSPATFDVNEFRTTGDPMGYMLNPANFVNYNVLYFSQADPAGSTQTCDVAAGNIAAVIGALTAGSPEAEAKMRLALGERLYNTAFDYADLTEAADVVFRGGLVAQDFMEAAMMRNFLAVGEAWRLAEYGTNQAQYVATITGSVEDQRIDAAAKGTIFLNMMFPLMTFFQFLFFTLAPFMALVMIASPFTAGKTIGMYLLFGVWAYSWMPVAALIDHYVQISIGNTIFYADVGAVGVEYTALAGMDSFYNLLANKIVIGSNALAATPVIVGAVLFGSLQGIMSLAGNLAGGAKVNTSISSPKIGEGRPLYTFGGRGDMPVGTRMAQGSESVLSTPEQRTFYGTAGAQSAVSSGVSAAQSRIDVAKTELGRSTSYLAERMDAAVQTGGVFSSMGRTIQTRAEESFNKSYDGVASVRDFQSMTADMTRQIYAELGLKTPFFGGGQATQETASNQQVYSSIMAHTKTNKASILAGLSESMTDNYQGQSSEVGDLRRATRDVQKNEEELERATNNERRVSKQAQAVSQITSGYTADTVDLVKVAASSRDARSMQERSRAKLAGILQGEFSSKQAAAEEAFRTGRNGKPIRGIDGRSDFNMDLNDWYGSWLKILGEDAANPRSWDAYVSLMSDLGMGVGLSDEFDTAALAGTHGVDAFGELSFQNIEEQIGTKNSRPEQAASIRQESQALRARGSERPDIPSAAREAHQTAFSGNQTTVDNDGFSGGAPKEAGQFNTLSDYIGASVSTTYSANQTLTDLGTELIGPDSGWRRSLEDTVPAALQNPDLIPQSLGRLNSELNAQYGGLEFKAMERYEAHLANNLTPQEALLATYAEVGANKPGFADYYGGVIAGLTGLRYGGNIDKALSKVGVGAPESRMMSKLGWARSVSLFGGAAVALGSAYLVHSNAANNEEQGVDMLKESFKAEFRRANEATGGSRDVADRFDAYVDGKQDVRGVLDAVVQFRQNDELTDEMLSSLEAQYRPRTLGDPGRVDGA